MVGFTRLGFVAEQFRRVPPLLTADLTGKSILITGANTGLGFETAKLFARMNPARLILACRNQQKAQEAVVVLANDTGYRAEIQIADFSKFEDIVALTKRLEGEPLDILVANAGIAQLDYRVTHDGWEETIHVNYLAAALLSILLLPNLSQGATLHNSTSRVVTVSSVWHNLATFCDHQNVLSQENILATLSSKEYCTNEVMALLEIMFTRAFAQHLSPAAKAVVVPTAVNPGYCVSDIARRLPWYWWCVAKGIETSIGRTGEQGARQIVYAAVGPDGKEGPHVRHAMSGAYVCLAAVKEPRDFVISKEGYEVQEKIWRETVDILSKAAPAVQGIVKQYLSG